jgi:hypothetical protein
LPVCQVSLPRLANSIGDVTPHRLAVLLSVRKLLADRQMGHAKKSVRHMAARREVDLRIRSPAFHPCIS